jgi:hypothetical protein
MKVEHWNLLDYAYCHYIKDNRAYLDYIELLNETKKKGLPFTEEEVLGLFYGTPVKPPVNVVDEFIIGEFKPTDKEYALDFILKSKNLRSRSEVVKLIVEEAYTKLNIGKKKNGNIELPSHYFESLVQSYIELVESLIVYNRETGRSGINEGWFKKLKISMDVLIKGGLYK